MKNASCPWPVLLLFSALLCLSSTTTNVLGERQLTRRTVVAVSAASPAVDGDLSSPHYQQLPNTQQFYYNHHYQFQNNQQQQQQAPFFVVSASGPSPLTQQHHQQQITELLPQIQPQQQPQQQQQSQLHNNINKNNNARVRQRHAQARAFQILQQPDGVNAVVLRDTAAVEQQQQQQQTVGTGGDGSSSFNTALLAAGPGGFSHLPGIKARLNSRGFQYLSTIFYPIINHQIKRARIPNINQCLPQLQGCVNVFNLYVSRYRCPQSVIIYPAPPNQIVVSVENLDIGVTGNLGGQITILVPLALFGIVQANIHQVSVRVALVISRGANGSPHLQMASCSVSVGYVDVYIENGGLIGDIASSQFRGQLSKMVRSKIPGMVCAQLPSIIDEQINSRLLAIPQTIPLTDILQFALSAFGLDSVLNIRGGGHHSVRARGLKTCPASCKKAVNGIKQIPYDNSSSPINQGKSTSSPSPTAVSGLVQLSSSRYNNYDQKLLHQPPDSKGNHQSATAHNRQHPSSLQSPSLLPPPGSDAPHAVIPPQQSLNNQHNHVVRQRKYAIHEPRLKRSSALVPPPTSSHHNTIRAVSVARNSGGARALAPSTGHVAFVPPGQSPCTNCTGADSDNNPLAALTVIAQSLDFSKLSNILLNVQIMNTYATTNDFVVELNGEFSPNGQGGTPFGAFQMDFPTHPGHKMIDILISDYTVNSLLYHLHRSGFINMRIGPNTPKIGPLLKTTCSSDEDSEGGQLEDHGVETDEATKRARREAILQQYHAALLTRNRRQDNSSSSSSSGGDSTGLADLGLCLGDILPAVREKHPNELVVIMIHSVGRAPSVIIHSGSALINLVLDADFYIQSSNTHVGTIRIEASLTIQITSQGRRLSAHASIGTLHLSDIGNKLGLSQDALDNLGNLGKEILLKAGNEVLERGTAVSVPQGAISKLPFNIIDPEVTFVEHGVNIASDFTISPQTLSSLGIEGDDGC